MEKTVLGIDRGSKYIGLAYAKAYSMVMPLGYLMNDGSFFFNLSDILVRYRIGKIVIGYPDKQEDIKLKIDDFINQLSMITGGNIEIEKINEDYSSVQAGEIIGEFRKNASEDTVSAMILLDRYFGS